MVSRRHIAPRQGNVAVLVACLLSVLIGFVGFSLDGGVMLTRKRECQAVADASAMAAACVFYQNYATIRNGNNGTSSYHAAATTAAQQMAAGNGYFNDAPNGNNTAPGTSSITVNFPPNFQNSTSIYNNGGSTPSPNYDMNLSDGVVEVVVHFYQPAYFTTVWGFSIVDIQARAVARGAWVAPKNGVLVLNYTAGSSLTDRGGGNSGGITVTGGNFVIDSNASNAVFDTGGAVITAPEFDITGGVSAPASGLQTAPTTGQIFSGMHPTPDPLAYLQPYAAQTFNSLPTADKSSVTGSGTAGDPYILQAGTTYTSLPKFTGNSNYIQIQGSGMLGLDTGGAVDVTGCTISGTGVCIYLNSGNLTCAGTGMVMCGSFDLNGNASGDFTGLTSTPLMGFVYYQPPTNTNDVKLTGNAGFSATGTFYAPTATTDIGGNATLGNFGSQWVSNMIFTHGNGNLTINYSGPAIAKTRLLCLIE
jgi:Flp pilus assembly protein TadG